MQTDLISCQDEAQGVGLDRAHDLLFLAEVWHPPLCDLARRGHGAVLDKLEQDEELDEDLPAERDVRELSAQADFSGCELNGGRRCWTDLEVQKA